MSRWFKPLAVPILFLLLGSAAASAAREPRPTPEDIAALASASGLALSPDGRSLVYALASATRDTAAKPAEGDVRGGWTRERQLWRLDLGANTPRRLTVAQERAGSPAWSPDGRSLAFLRACEGRAAIHVLDLEGGEPRVVDTGELVPTSLRWAPDGAALGFTAPEPLTPAAKESRWRSGEVVEWDAEWRSEQVWSVPREGGAPRRLTRGDRHVVDWDWSPDGTRLFVIASESADPYAATSLCLPHIVSAADGRVLRTLEREPRDLEHPRWSPDGRWVAYLACREGLSMLNSLRVADAASGDARELSPSLDPTFATFEWLPDSRAVVALVRERTRTPLWRLEVAGGAPADLGFAGRVIDGPIAVSRDGARIVFLSSTSEEPADPTAFEPATGRVRVLTRLNPAVAGWALGTTELVRWTGPEGTPLEGLLTLPRGARTPPPLVVIPHGGPDDVTPERFFAQSHHLAARGYAVFRPNYRGGLGYGFDSYAANRGRLGDIESMDIESGVDALVADGRVDPRDLFFGGWSWGGYISVWTLAHATRYRAHVVGASIFDPVLSYGLSDINHGWAAQWEYRGDPWRDMAAFDRASPMRAIRNARAPTLVLHGDSDTRVPFGQSVLLYRALRDLGVPVRFHVYPREDHGLVEPAHVAHRLRVWAEWYDMHRAPGRGR